MQKTSAKENQMQYVRNGRQNYDESEPGHPAYLFSSTSPRSVINVTQKKEPSPFSANSHGCLYLNHANLSEYLNVASSNPEISRSRSIPHLFSESREGLRHFPSVPVLNFRQCNVPINHHYLNPEIHVNSNEHAQGSPQCLSYSPSHEMLAHQPVCTHPMQQNEEVLMYKIMCEQKDTQLKWLEQQLLSTNNYLKLLPTTEQLQNLEKTCAISESDKGYTIKMYKELHRVLNDVREDLKQKNLYVEQLEKKNLRYRAKIGNLNQYILNQHSGKDDSEENLIQERDNLLAELKLLKKKMNNYERANDALQKKYTRDIEALRENLEEEKNFQQAQKTELRYKEETILSLKAQMKEADEKRNQFLEDNFGLEEKVKTLTLVNSKVEERYTMEKKLFRELRGCVAELKAIAEIIEDEVSGRNPNLSFLLGNPALSVISHSKNHGPTNKSILNEINEAEDLNKNLSKLREDLSDKYAEHLGSELKCLTQ